MLKRDITYQTYDDPPRTITETFYFNINRNEALDIYLGRNNLEEIMQAMVKSDDRKGMVDEFKTLIIASYGVRSDDGKKFIKPRTDAERAEFIDSAAYDALFYELMTDEKKFQEFLMGIMPKEVSEEMAKNNVFENTELPPLPPSA